MSAAARAIAGFRQMAPISTRSTGTPRSWGGTRRGQTVCLRRVRVSPSPTAARRGWRDSDSLNGGAMIQSSNMARLGGHQRQRTRLRNTAGLALDKGDPWFSRAARQGFNQGKAVLGTSKPGIATPSISTIVLWKGAEPSPKDQPTSWWNPMLDATTQSYLSEDLGAVGSREASMGNPSDKDLQRSDGAGRVVVSGSENGTRIIDVFQRSPIRIMFPRDGGAAAEEAGFYNTPGGGAGGDKLESGVTALANASIAVTSQAAEKIYRALNERARVVTKLKACATAKLAWLPQETIIFNRGRVSRQTEIEVSSGSELLALE